MMAAPNGNGRGAEFLGPFATQLNSLMGQPNARQIPLR
jgi:hypothetical protein